MSRDRYPVDPAIIKAKLEEQRSERERSLQLARLALLGKLVDETGMLWSVDIQTRSIPGRAPIEYVYTCSPVIPALATGLFVFNLVDLSPDHVDYRLIELSAKRVLDLWRSDLQRGGLTEEAALAIIYNGKGGKAKGEQ